MKIIKIDNIEIEITNPDKILFPESKITKMDLVNYYDKIADKMLPFLKDRPLTLHHFPHGIKEKGFFQQHATTNLPNWIKTFSLSKIEGGKMLHVLCQNKATLIYLANHDVIPIHRWLSTIKNPEYPDIIVMDIDCVYESFDLAKKAAKIYKKKLQDQGYSPEVMTTGSRGLHIYSNVKKKVTFEDMKEFLTNISEEIVNKFPNEFTLEIRKDIRAAPVYLDLSRNSYGQTTIAPYSVRPKEKAPIAMPINWGDLEKVSHGDDFNIKNIKKSK